MKPTTLTGTRAGTFPAFGPLSLPGIPYPIDAVALKGAFPKDLNCRDWAFAHEQVRAAFSDGYVKNLNSALFAWWGYCWTYGIDPCTDDEIVASRFLKAIIRTGARLEFVYYHAHVLRLLSAWLGTRLRWSAIITALLRQVRTSANPPKRKAAFQADRIRAACDVAVAKRSPLVAIRDCGALLLMHISAIRGLEAVDALRDDVTIDEDGMTVMIPKSKTDRRGEGQPVFIHRTGTRYCPVAAIEACLASHPFPQIFQRVENNGTITRGNGLTTQGLRRTVKSYAQAVGFNPDDFANHSTRSGFITDGFDRDASESDMQRVTRHRRIESMWKYDRRGPRTNFADLFEY